MCGHECICTACIDQMLIYEHTFAYNGIAYTFSRNSGWVKCPLCRQVSRVLIGGCPLVGLAESAEELGGTYPLWVVTFGELLQSSNNHLFDLQEMD